MKTLEAYSEMSQRQLAESMGVSSGKLNYRVKALLKKGLLKVTEFRNNKNKIVYTYLLTSKGLKRKALLARLFLERKIEDYERLESEIRHLRTEVQKFPRKKNQLKDLKLVENR